MNYKTIKIFLANSIEDECCDYLRFACEQSNKLYNSVVYAIRQAHFERCSVRTFFDKNDLYRTSLKLSKVQVSYPQLCKELKFSEHYQAI